jgi:hypothetical protein
MKAINLKDQTIDGKRLEVGNPDHISALKDSLQGKKRRTIEIFYKYKNSRGSIYTDTFTFCVGWDFTSDHIQHVADDKVKKYQKYNPYTRQTWLLFPHIIEWHWRDITPYMTEKKRRAKRVKK